VDRIEGAPEQAERGIFSHRGGPVAREGTAESIG